VSDSIRRNMGIWITRNWITRHRWIFITCKIYSRNRRSM